MRSLLWYPQLDVYDTVRRFAGLLRAWRTTEAWPSLERLYIGDFFFANPPLLHKTQMKAAARAEFNKLGVTRPEKSFLSYPSAPILFQKMEEVQKSAIRTLIAKGLINLYKIENGIIEPSEAGIKLFSAELSNLFDEREIVLLRFIVRSFLDVDDIYVLRRNAGVRRVAR